MMMMDESNDWSSIEIMSKSDIVRHLIGEGDQKREEVLHKLARRLLDEDSLISFPRSDAYLIRFLRARNFNLEQALRLVRNYEGLTNAGWRHVSLSECQRLSCVGAVHVLPQKDTMNGRRIVWLRPALWDPSQHDSDMFMKTGALSADALSVEPDTQHAGIVVLFDLAHFGLAQLRALSPAFAKKLVHLLANCLPMRVHGVHLLNEPPFFSMVFSIYKKFLDDRMKKRLFFHGHNLNSLHKHVSPEALPEELGGFAPKSNPAAWAKAIGHKDIVNELRGFGYQFTDLN